MTRAWLHIGGTFARCVPVEVLSHGPKRSRVRLTQRLREKAKWSEAGSTRHVPTWALGPVPGDGYLVSTGRGGFVGANDPRARAEIKRWSSPSKGAAS